MISGEDLLPPPGERATPEVLAFRATIVMKKKFGRPTLADVQEALRRAGLRFVMPADVAWSIVYFDGGRRVSGPGGS